MEGRRRLHWIAALTLIALLATTGAAWAQLKVTAQPLHGWDYGLERFENGNLQIWLGNWTPFYIQLDTFDDVLVTDACGPGTSTKWAGNFTVGMGYEDTNGDPGGTGFRDTEDWTLVECNPTGPGQYVPWNCPTCAFTRSVDDDVWVPGTCTGSTCRSELVNEFFVNLDANCDGAPDTALPDTGLCVYWEAYTLPPNHADYVPWAGNLQVRVDDGGGDKTLNATVFYGPNAVALRRLNAQPAVSGAAILATLAGLSAAGLLLRRRIR